MIGPAAVLTSLLLPWVFGLGFLALVVVEGRFRGWGRRQIASLIFLLLWTSFLGYRSIRDFQEYRFVTSLDEVRLRGLRVGQVTVRDPAGMAFFARTLAAGRYYSTNHPGYARDTVLTLSLASGESRSYVASTLVGKPGVVLRYCGGSRTFARVPDRCNYASVYLPAFPLEYLEPG